MSLHAHMTSSSRDCDGDYTGGHVYEMTTLERDDQFGDLHFQDRVVASTVSLCGHGTLTVTPDGVKWNEQTTEGYHRTEVRWCSHRCTPCSWQRDHSAEKAGY